MLLHFYYLNINYQLNEYNIMNANPVKYPFLSSLKVSEDVRRRLALHLDRIVTGSDTVHLSAIGKSHNPSDILSSFDKLFSDNTSLFSPALLDIENSNRSKFGTRSKAIPWSERIDIIGAYFKDALPTTLKFDPNLSEGRLRPISVKTASKLLRPNTNSGLPYYRKKSLALSDTLSNYLNILKEDYPCILFTRTQEGGKTRTVWGYPMADTLREYLIYSPLLGHQKELKWRAALLGPDAVDKFISSLFLAKSPLAFILSVDFSQFDSTVGTFLQKFAFAYIKSLFQEQFHKELDLIAARFNNIGLLTPAGISHGPHGVPSGSTFTNEVDSIVQYLVAKDSGISISDMQIQGDDGLYLLDNEEDCNYLIKHFEDKGLKVNVEKSMISNKKCIYLQRLYDEYYIKDGFIGGIYSCYRALNRIIYQERFTNFDDFGLEGVDYYSIRTISILENVKYHPMFEKFVQFVYNLDKYKLKFSDKAIDNYYSLIKDGQGSAGILNNQFGDDVRGIRGFETFKIISRLG